MLAGSLRHGFVQQGPRPFSLGALGSTPRLRPAVPVCQHVLVARLHRPVRSAVPTSGRVSPARSSSRQLLRLSSATSLSRWHSRFPSARNLHTDSGASSDQSHAEPALATYEGPLRNTFTRLKLFSLGSLGLASALVPIFLFASAALTMPARIGLCATALVTSGTSTALIAWIGATYVGTMALRPRSASKGETGAGKGGIVGGTTEETQPILEMTTVDWRLRGLHTVVYAPSFLRATSRPFATWELSSSPVPLKLSASHVPADLPPTLVAETIDVKKGVVVGRWWARWRSDARTRLEDGTWAVEGVCEAEGKPVRYFNVHEELLGEEWKVLG